MTDGDYSSSRLLVTFDLMTCLEVLHSVFLRQTHVCAASRCPAHQRITSTLQLSATAWTRLPRSGGNFSKHNCGCRIPAPVETHINMKYVVVGCCSGPEYRIQCGFILAEIYSCAQNTGVSPTHNLTASVSRPGAGMPAEQRHDTNAPVTYTVNTNQSNLI